MEITYKNKQIKSVCTNFSTAQLNYGEEMAFKISQRIEEISAASNVYFLISNNIGRCHELQGKRKKQYAVDLVHPYRLIFTVSKKGIQIARIEEIVDYH